MAASAVGSGHFASVALHIPLERSRHAGLSSNNFKVSNESYQSWYALILRNSF